LLLAVGEVIDGRLGLDTAGPASPGPTGIKLPVLVLAGEKPLSSGLAAPASATSTCIRFSIERFNGSNDPRSPDAWGGLPGSVAFANCRVVVGASKVRGSQESTTSGSADETVSALRREDNRPGLNTESPRAGTAASRTTPTAPNPRVSQTCIILEEFDLGICTSLCTIDTQSFTDTWGRMKTRLAAQQ
jgi:hypothetical protein